jgi:hypothetical protein
MLGGKVISIVRTSHHTLLTVRDPIFGDPLPIRVQEQRQRSGEAVTIGLGDVVQCHGDVVAWTPKTFLTHMPTVGRGVTWGILLPRVGQGH